ncbi:alpha/beta hydrolase [Amycolatopsis sp. H20-H5]|uniref:alpha/beta hydrolase n=1 Tax=Amycolatopsis sp. H20-H5 TaxID=3046309 RepID=UPI002DB8AB98|nr:alpha/beta hydrolase [Amycolatopsis sp. H20-H5]MEC3982261.1 alpha/beta hydrolase [Amycolatopsis sp. H20-H5]
MTYAFDADLAAAVAMMPKIDVTDLETVRKTIVELLAEAGPPDESGVTITEQQVSRADGPDVLLRIYRPDDAAPAAIYSIFGGGFILGSVDNEHAHSLKLARATGAVVVAVQYRLAPENPYPAGLEDCYAGLEWLAAHAAELGVDPDRIAIRGYSAGGGLSAALALLARDRGGPRIRFQYLGVPEIDDRLETQSSTQFVDTPMWNRPNAIFSWDSYLGEGNRGGADVPVHAAPARATDVSGLPPAYISAMEFDPLRDEGIAYALKLIAAGIPVELHVFSGTFHGSSTVEHAQASQREAAEEVTVLRRALGL